MVYPPTATEPYHRLLALIVRGRLAPGTPLVEAEVATRLGISRTPVREAFQRLRFDGLAITTGGGERPRLAVAPLSRDAVAEVYRAAGALEGVAGREAHALGRAEREALARRMAGHDKGFRRAAKSKTPVWDVLFEQHDAFHRELQRATAGPRTRALLDVLRPQVDRYEWFFAPLTGPDFSATYAEHDAIIRAVRVGSALEIERAVRANWFNGAARLAEVIEHADTRMLTGSGWDTV